MYHKISVRPHQIKVNAGTSVKKGAFITKGGLKGVALTDSDDNDDVVIVVAGLLGEAPIVAAGGGSGVTEGTYLVWSGVLLDNAGAFTDSGASAGTHDAIAGHGVSLAAGEDGAGDVWMGL